MRESHLVLHGEQNPPTARDVDRARPVTFPGIGRDLPTALRPAVTREMRELAATASAQPDAGHRRLSAYAPQ